jgi:hypothetical protein
MILAIHSNWSIGWMKLAHTIKSIAPRSLGVVHDYLRLHVIMSQQIREL